MIYIYLTLGALVGVVVCLSGLIVVIQSRHNELLMAMSIKSFEKEQTWNAERQQLLDRIQAPSYDVMKHHEVKIIKAKNNEKEPEKLEVM